MDVPPTLISFAIAPIKASEVLSPEFKEAGHPVYLFAPVDETAESVKETWETFHTLCTEGKVKAAWAVENGIAEAVMKMSFGNEIGFKATAKLNPADWHLPFYGYIVAELTEDVTCRGTLKLGKTTEKAVIARQ